MSINFYDFFSSAVSARTICRCRCGLLELRFARLYERPTGEQRLRMVGAGLALPKGAASGAHTFGIIGFASIISGRLR